MIQSSVISDPSDFQARLRVSSFFRWWFSELTTLVPSSLLKLMQPQQKWLVMDIHERRILLMECHDGQGKELGEYPLEQDGNLSVQGLAVLRSALNKAATELVIRLSRSQFMTRTVILPNKTEENLREVLGYEMDKETPFRVEQVYYDYQIVKRVPEQQQIEVELVFVPRVRVEQLMNRVRAWGGQPAVMTVAEERGNNVGQCHISSLNLLPQEQRLASGDSGNMINRLLAASALILTLIALFLPLFWQKLTISELEQRIATVREEAEAVQAMQKKIDTLRSESGLILEKKQQYPPVIEILNELSRLLPDDTWLERLNIKGPHINIQGYSIDAPALIELLENSSLFRDVAFDSPITRDPQTNRNRFQIGADITAMNP